MELTIKLGYLLSYTLFHVYIVQASKTASVEVVIYENTGQDYTTYTYELKGTFSKAGAATSAEGDIVQVGFKHLIAVINSFSRDFIERRNVNKPRVAVASFA